MFQAICRTNRIDGEDKQFGYIVDFKDLFKKVEKAIAVYTSELDKAMHVTSQCLHKPKNVLSLALEGLGKCLIGLPNRNRTCDPQLRRLMLYPAELWAAREWYLSA